jgi:hypothetical protein
MYPGQTRVGTFRVRRKRLVLIINLTLYLVMVIEFNMKSKFTEGISHLRNHSERDYRKTLVTCMQHNNYHESLISFAMETVHDERLL